MRSSELVVVNRSLPLHYGNLMMNYMVAKRIEAEIPGTRLSNYSLPYFGIEVPFIQPAPNQRSISFVREQQVDFMTLSYIVRNRIVDRIELKGYGFRLEYFPDLEDCRRMFVRDDLQVPVVDGGHILCPIRASEILDARHSGYPLIPIDYYSDIIEECGLVPVFMGQTEENQYISSLRSRFPKAEFLPKATPIEDFQTIRSASNIAIPVSTFAWLASWLSNANLIYYPIFGIFDPAVFREPNLLPVRDDRYRCYQFPRLDAVPLDAVEDAHATIRGMWRRVDPLDVLAATL